MFYIFFIPLISSIPLTIFIPPFLFQLISTQIFSYTYLPFTLLFPYSNNFLFIITKFIALGLFHSKWQNFINIFYLPYHILFQVLLINQVSFEDPYQNQYSVIGFRKFQMLNNLTNFCFIEVWGFSCFNERDLYIIIINFKAIVIDSYFLRNFNFSNNYLPYLNSDFNLCFKIFIESQ